MCFLANNVTVLGLSVGGDGEETIITATQEQWWWFGHQYMHSWRPFNCEEPISQVCAFTLKWCDKLWQLLQVRVEFQSQGYIHEWQGVCVCVCVYVFLCVSVHLRVYVHACALFWIPHHHSQGVIRRWFNCQCCAWQRNWRIRDRSWGADACRQRRVLHCIRTTNDDFERTTMLLLLLLFLIKSN